MPVAFIVVSNRFRRWPNKRRASLFCRLSFVNNRKTILRRPPPPPQPGPSHLRRGYYRMYCKVVFSGGGGELRVCYHPPTPSPIPWSPEGYRGSEGVGLRFLEIARIFKKKLFEKKFLAFEWNHDEGFKECTYSVKFTCRFTT